MTRAIFNLKQAVQNRLGITVFKNHKQQILQIDPINSKSEYFSEDIIRWDLKGHGVDYINLKNSYIRASIILQRSINNVWASAGGVFPMGMCPFIKRQRLLFGSNELSSVDNPGILNWMVAYGGGHYVFHNGENGVQYGGDFGFVSTNFTGSNFQEIVIPFNTILDNGDEIPVFQIADRLILEILLNKEDEFIMDHDENDPARPYRYMLKNLALVINGRLATSGGILLSNEFLFHSFDWRNYSDVLDPTKNRQLFTYDLKKSSVKKCIGRFVKNTTTQYENRFSFVQSHKGALTSYIFKMGGKNIPFDYPITSDLDMWYMFRAFFHKLTNFVYGENENIFFGHKNNVNGNWEWDDEHFQNNYFWITGVFDRLPQNTNVLSGISTERFDIQLEMIAGGDGPNFWQIDSNLLFWFCYDIIVHITGGVIDIED